MKFSGAKIQQKQSSLKTLLRKRSQGPIK